MSFGDMGGMGGMEQALTYMIKAYDMATPVFKAFQEQVSLTTKSVQTSLTEMNRALEAQTRAVDDAVAKERASLASLSKSYDTAAMSSVDAAKFQAESAKKMAAASQSAATSATKASEQESKAADSSVASSRRAAAAAKASAEESAASAKKTEAAFGAASSGLSKFGRNTLIATSVVAAGSLDMATKFNANTLRMETQAGATAKGLNQIRQGLLAMAPEVGVMPNTLANGMYHVVSAMNAVLPPATRVSQELRIQKIAAEGAQVGHSNLEDTTYALSSALNALHESAKQAGGVMGQLNAIVGSGDMTMQDLLDAFKSGLIPAANSFGVSLQSVGAALSVMGDMGMRGALAGTRLRMALSLLGAPSKQAVGILETLGLTSDQAMASTDRMSKLLAAAGVRTTMLTQDLRKPDGLQVALSDLDKHLKSNGLSADAAAAAISRAFGGGRMGAAIMLMAENTDRLKIKFNQIGESGRNFGKDWQLTSETFKVQLEKAGAAIEALGIKLGTWLLPYATKALTDLEDMANWLSKNKTVMEALGLSIITFASVAIGSYFIGKVSKAVDLMKDFGKGTQSMGRWLFNMPAGGATGAAGAASVADRRIINGIPVTASNPSAALLGGGNTSGTMFGYMGSTIRVGTMMNPIAVTMAGKGANISQTGGVASTATPPAAVAAATDITDTTPNPAVINQPGELDSAELDRRLAAADAQLQEQMSLFDNAAMGMTAAMAKAEEQLNLSGIANREGGLASRELQTVGGLGIPGRATKNLTRVGTGLENLTAEELFMAQYGHIPGAQFAGPASELGLMEGIPTRGASLASGAKGLMSRAGGGLMRGGMMAGMGVLGAQAVGGMIGGRTGREVSSIGTDVSLGAGAGMALGSLVPVIGTAVGGLIGGVGGAIVGGLHTLFTESSFGHKVADSLTPGFGGKNRDTLQQSVAKSLDELHKFTTTSKQTVGARGSILTEQVHLKLSDLDSADQAKAIAAANHAGTLIAKQLEAGWNQYKFQSTPVMFTQMMAEIKKLPPQAQDAAIQSAAKFVEGLQSKGRIAEGSTQDFLKRIEAQFPGFAQYMGMSAQSSVDAFNKAFDFKETEQNMSAQLKKVENDFSPIQEVVSQTAGGIHDKMSAAVDSLKLFASGTGKSARQAKADLKDLQDSAQGNLSAMVNSFDSSTTSITKLLKKGSQDAINVAETNYGKVVSTVSDDMASGVTSTKNGMGDIGKALNTMLQSMGEPKITFASVSKLHPGAGGKTAAGLTAPGLAVGGMVHEPMYMVGEEAPTHPEYVLATNPAYRSRNVGLWKQAGRHLGQPVPGYAKGGYIDPIPGYSIGRTDQGVDANAAVGTPILAMGDSRLTSVIPNWYSNQPLMDFQLLNGPDAGRFWYVAEQISPVTTKTGTTFKEGQIVARYAPSGTGIEIGWAANAAGQTLAKATSGYSEGQVTPAGASFASFIGGLAHGKIVGGMPGMLGAAPTIDMPNVKGTGPVASIAQAALGKATNAANATLAALYQQSAGSGGPPGGHFPGSLMAWLTTALKLTNHFSSGNLAALAGRAMQESNGDPHSINNWDSNAKAGHPSKGLLQDIDSTFNQYMLPGHGDIWNPIDNAIASIRYMYARYGHIVGPGSGGYKMGGIPGKDKLGWAGMFGDGGSFTVDKPTLALFGEKGPESVLAVSGHQDMSQYGVVRSGTSTTTGTTSKGDPTNTKRTTTTTQNGNTRTTTTQSTHTGPQGTSHNTTTTTTTHTTPDHWTWGYNPITGQVEYHNTKQWQLIHAEYSKQRHIAIDQKKKIDAAKRAQSIYLSQPIHDTLDVGGIVEGHIDLDRREAKKLGLPFKGRGGKIDLEKDLTDLSETAWTKIVAELKKSIATQSLTTQTTVANRLSSNLAQEGDHPLIKEQNTLQKHLNKLHHERQTKTVRHQEHVTQQHLTQIQSQISGSRPAQLANTAIAAALGNVDSTLTSQTTAGTIAKNLKSDLSKLDKLMADAVRTHTQKLIDKLTKQESSLLLSAITEAGTALSNQESAGSVIHNLNKDLGSLDKIAKQGHRKHLTSVVSKANKEIATTLRAGVSESATTLGGQQSDGTVYANVKGDLSSLDKIVNQGTKRHMAGTVAIAKKQIAATLTAGVSEITTNISNQASEGSVGANFGGDMNQLLTLQKNAQKRGLGAIADSAGKAIQGLWKSLIDENAQNLQNTNDMLQGGSDLTTAVQGLKAGTNLASIGLSPAVLQRMGIDPNQAQGLVGNSNPMAAAQLSNSFLAQQRSNDAGALQTLLQEMPSLNGNALTDANSQVKSLSSSIASLTSEINNNLIQAIQATAQSFQDQADIAKGGGDLLTAIADIPAGTNLSSLGFSPSALSSLGIDPGLASAVMGGGPNAISAEQQAQNGQLTPQQLASATAYYTGSNANIQQQLGGAGSGLIGEFNYDISQLPSLTGSDRNTMIQSIDSLGGTIAGLIKSMGDNTSALNGLTSATNANTSATGQMTGTVGYQYQGQSYTADLASDSTLNLGVGG